MAGSLAESPTISTFRRRINFEAGGPAFAGPWVKEFPPAKAVRQSAVAIDMCGRRMYRVAPVRSLEIVSITSTSCYKL